MIRRALTVSALAAIYSISAQAETVYIDSTLQGWVNSSGGQIEPSPTHNMFTGNEFSQRYNSYAAFFIPSGRYSSATISVNPSVYGNAGANLIELYDVSTPLSDLINTSHPGSGVFADLGSGSEYGSATLSDTYTTFALGGSFISDANSAASAGHYLLIGFTNATLNAQPSGAQQDDGIYIGGVGLQEAPILLTLATAAVPEPSSWALMIAGFGLVGTIRRRGTMRVTA